MNLSQFQPINIISNPSVKRSSGLVQFTLKVFSLVTIENERAIILGPCDVTFPCPFGAENRQLFARVCARSIAPSVVLSMICGSARRHRERMDVLNAEPDAGLASLPTPSDYMSSFSTEINMFALINIYSKAEILIACGVASSSSK